jgi:hypothetical protein
LTLPLGVPAIIAAWHRRRLQRQRDRVRPDRHRQNAHVSPARAPRTPVAPAALTVGGLPAAASKAPCKAPTAVSSPAPSATFSITFRHASALPHLSPFPSHPRPPPPRRTAALPAAQTAAEGTSQYLVRVSFLQIYNEKWVSASHPRPIPIGRPTLHPPAGFPTSWSLPRTSAFASAARANLTWM